MPRPITTRGAVMAAATLTPAEDPAPASQARLRLIDHFKRAYQIIVGLAITNACGKLFYSGTGNFPALDFWQFCTFFITIVPIFHGGDRSLDIKYLGGAPEGFCGRLFYLWDVYMLLITAILFVKVSQTILGPSSIPLLPWIDSEHPETAFYHWMFVLMAIDVVILVIDGMKNRLKPHAELGAYWKWIILNALFALVCYLAAFYWLPSGWSPERVGMWVFLAALARTAADYWFGRSFMFP